MTGSDIKHIRTSRGLSFRQMAALLRDASHTTVSRWEDAPDDPLPSWVAERLLGELTITMSASTFATLLQMAATPEALFSEALASYAQQIRTAETTPFPIAPLSREEYEAEYAQPTGPIIDNSEPLEPILWNRGLRRLSHSEFTISNSSAPRRDTSPAEPPAAPPGLSPTAPAP